MRYLLLYCLVAPGWIALGASVEIRTSELPWAILRSGYSAAIETGVDGRCPSGNVKLALSAGRLPDGLELRGSLLSGTPRALGSFHFAVRASNDCGAATREFDLLVTGRPILYVGPQDVNFEWRAGEAAPARTLRIAATWPELPYSIRTEAPWLSVSESGGATPPEGSALSASVVSLRAVVKDLAPGVYQSRVIVSSWVGPAAIAIPVKLTVRPAETAAAAR